MFDCSLCTHYNHGRGEKTCLKCKKYLTIQIKSGRRESIRTEHLPQEVMDNIPNPYTKTLINTLHRLPTNYAVPIVMRAVLNMSLKEIADYQNVSRAAVQQRITKGVKIIKQLLIEA